jgi:hypothetical protein
MVFAARAHWNVGEGPQRGQHGLVPQINDVPNEADGYHISRLCWGRSANGSETAMSIEEVFFQPEQIDAMHAAFVIVCARLRLRIGSKESDRVALKIVDLANEGEHDAKRLVELALSAGRKAIAG